MRLSFKDHLQGERHEILMEDVQYPSQLKEIANPPKTLYLIGDPGALKEGLAVVGARKATPYGISCAKHFSMMAAERGLVIISGGARGCDAAAHEAALNVGGQTVVFLGGGCDEVYPPEHLDLFQRVIDSGGAVVSENKWDCIPKPYMFRERNRLIAGLGKATLIVEAGLPSGTFSTADEALAANREVLVVPGAVSSKQSRGANRLIYQGATPIVDDDTFADQLFSIFGLLKQESLPESKCPEIAAEESYLLKALDAEPLGIEELMEIAKSIVKDGDPATWLMVWLAKATRDGFIAQYPDGRYGSVLRCA